MLATLVNRRASWLTAILFSSFSALAQSVTLFPGVTVKHHPYINLMADAPDGGYFLATQVDAVNGTPTGNIAKVDASGTVDPDFERVTVNGDIFSILTLQSGQILIGGDFTQVNGVAYHGIARLESDGSLDTSFPVPLDPLVHVNRIAVQSDGKIIVVGQLILLNHTTVLRLNTDGTLDATFVYDPATAFGTMTNVVVDSQDNIWLTDTKSVFRLNAAGAIQSGFPISVGAGSSVYHLVSKADKAYVGGTFTSISGSTKYRMALVKADGSIDASFNPPSFVTDVDGLGVKSDGKVVALHLGSVNVYNASGTFLTSVSTSQPESILVDANQQIIISGGTNLLINGNLVPFLGRVDDTFAYDNSFTCTPTYSHGVTAVAGYPDGRILMGGNYEVIGFNSSLKRLVRVTRDGTVDPTFDATIPSSSVLPRFSIVALVLQPGEKIVVTTNEKMFRLLPDGATDNTFPQITVPSGGLLSRAREKSGKLLLAGSFNAVSSYSSPGILRFDANGAVDNSFVSGLPSSSFVTDFAFQSDGKIIVVGFFPASPTPKVVMRLQPNGGVDNTFTSASVASNGVWKVGVDSQDKIYISGDFLDYNGSGRNNFLRLSPAGPLDGTFSFPPATFVNNAVQESLEILSDNEIVVGSRQTYGEKAIYVFDAAGTLVDKPFSHLGHNPSITSMLFNGQTLYLGGHLVSAGSDETAGLGVVNLVPVTGTVNNLAVSRSSRYQAEVTWDNSTLNGNFIIIERAEGNTNSFVQLAALAPLSTSYSDVGIKGVEEYHYRVRAVNSSSVTSYSNTGSIPALPKLDQTITFEEVPQKTLGDAPFSLVFSASSGLPVEITSSFPFIASVDGNLVTIHSQGDVVLTAQQSGDLEYNAAPAVERTLAVAMSLSGFRNSRYEVILNWNHGDDGLMVVERSEGNPNSFEVIEDHSQIAGGGLMDAPVKGVAEYYYRVRDLTSIAYSNTVYIPALPKADQAITFEEIPEKSYGDAPFALTTSASSELTVTVSSSDPSIASVVNNTVTIHSHGEVKLTAQQSGDLENNAAPSVERTLVVKLVLSVTRSSRYEAHLTWADNSGGSIVIERSEGNSNSFAQVATIAISSPGYTDNGIKGVAEYSYRIRDLNSVSYSNVVSIPALPKLNQTIEFAAVPAKKEDDDPFSLTFSASSGLPVSVTSSNPTVATVEDKLVTIQSAGTVTLKAQQGGDLEYNAAPDVDRTLVINVVLAVMGKEDKIAFPNPSEGTFEVRLGTKTFAGTAYVHNSTGTLIATIAVETVNGIFQLDLSNFPPGLYVLKLSDTKSESTFKLVRK